MLQSRQRDFEPRSRIGSRRRRRRGSLVPADTRGRPSTYGGTMPFSLWEGGEPEVCNDCLLMSAHMHYVYIIPACRWMLLWVM